MMIFYTLKDLRRCKVQKGARDIIVDYDNQWAAGDSDQHVQNVAVCEVNELSLIQISLSRTELYVN